MKQLISLLVVASAALMGCASSPTASTSPHKRMPTENVLDGNNPGPYFVREQLGLGEPASVITFGADDGAFVGDGMYHVPQYLPNHPTAATIWPRAIEVECEDSDKLSNLTCDGYHWAPSMGRGEYLFVIPKIKKMPRPPVIIEVPPKKKAQ